MMDGKMKVCFSFRVTYDGRFCSERKVFWTRLPVANLCNEARAAWKAPLCRYGSAESWRWEWRLLVNCWRGSAKRDVLSDYPSLLRGPQRSRVSSHWVEHLQQLPLRWGVVRCGKARQTRFAMSSVRCCVSSWFNCIAIALSLRSRLV